VKRSICARYSSAGIAPGCHARLAERVPRGRGPEEPL